MQMLLTYSSLPPFAETSTEKSVSVADVTGVQKLGSKVDVSAIDYPALDEKAT